MGTISQLHERSRPIARRIESDDEALDVARSLALSFAGHASERDMNRILPQDEIDSLSASGLLGISVPAEYDGLDISNSILAEITAILAQADPSIGEIARGHYQVLEVLRGAGSNEQKALLFARALAGDRFVNALAITDAQAAAPDRARLIEEGFGFRLAGRKSQSSGILFADWIAIAAHDGEDDIAACLVPRRTEGVQIIDDWDSFGLRTTGSGTLILHNVHVNADALLPRPGADRPAMAQTVGQLLHAAVDLGIARSAFSDIVASMKSDASQFASDDPLTIARIGQVSIRIEAAAAMVEKAGEKVDVAQVTTTAEHVLSATLGVAAAKVVAAEISAEAANTLFDLAGPSSTRIGDNLDRHWRNARAHAMGDRTRSTRSTHHAIGDYHLNGVAPPQDPAR